MTTSISSETIEIIRNMHKLQKIEMRGISSVNMRLLSQLRPKKIALTDGHADRRTDTINYRVASLLKTNLGLHSRNLSSVSGWHNLGFNTRVNHGFYRCGFVNNICISLPSLREINKKRNQLNDKYNIYLKVG